MAGKFLIVFVGLYLIATWSCIASGKEMESGNSKKPKCPEICTEQYDPVCGTDGKTYGNKCLLKVAMCKNESLQLQHPGICLKPCEKACTREYRPHCGSDKRTYGNKCTFEVAQCKNESLRLLYTRECGSHEGICPRNRGDKCGKKCDEDKDCLKTEKCCASKCGATCSAICRASPCHKCSFSEKQVTSFDKDGCPVCKCQRICRPKICKKCFSGYRKDKFGCPSCRCKKPKYCKQRLCFKPCIGGTVLDKHGCPTCICRPRPPCPRMRCPIRCKFNKRKMLPTLFGCYRCVCSK